MAEEKDRVRPSYSLCPLDRSSEEPIEIASESHDDVIMTKSYLFKVSLSFELQIYKVEIHCGSCVFHTIVRIGLNRNVQQMRCLRMMT